MSQATSLELRLRCFAPTGDSGAAWNLCGAATACLRTAHLLADGTGQWVPTPRPAGMPPLHEEASDSTLELKDGVTVRRRFSAPSRVEPGVEAQDYTFTAVGWPGAKLTLSGSTHTVDATGRIDAESPRAAVSLWKALLPALREAGWRDLTLADPAGGPMMEAAANAGNVPVVFKLLRESLHADLAAHVKRWAWKDGTLDLPVLFSRPLSAGALDALLRALPAGELRDLRLPYADCSPLPKDLSLLGGLVRLEGAFAELPPPPALARLEHLAFYGRLPVNAPEYAWDELAALRRLDLHDLELEALPAALALSPSLRELRVSARGPLRLEQTSSYGPLRLERLELEQVPVFALPSSDSLQHLVLTQCELPFGALPPLPALKTLTLHGCRWASLPSGMGQMQQLESLTVEDCPLATLDALPPLPALRVISLCRTRLEALPVVLETLPRLELFEASHAGPGLDAEALRARLPHLKSLHVTGS